MSTIGHIVVPIDFSDQSLIALKQSYNLAKMNNAELFLIHVLDKPLFDRLKEFSVGKENYEHLLEEGIKTKLEEIAGEPRQLGLKVSVFVERGKIYDKISDCAEKFDNSLIILGTRGKISIKKRFIGTNALRLIKIAPCPVITIHGQTHKDGCDNIILPLDINKETKEKVTKAIELAKAFQSNITLVTISDSNDEFIVNKLKRQLHQVKEIIKNQNVSCKSEWINGDDVAKEVLEYAQQVNADLIMIMTQQETNWIEYFIGSAAQEIINNSKIPVLSIRPIKRKNLTEFVVQ